MPLPLVVVNPESAGGATGRAWPAIASDLRSHFGAFTIAFTEKSAQGVALASEAARRGVRLIIACGGDGTISEVANGILESGKEAELGILPSGTGGDFRRTIEIPTRTRDAAQILRRGQTRLIDVGRVTYENTSGSEDSRYFIGVASFGMSAAVIERVKEKGPGVPAKATKWLSGQVAFGSSMLQTAMQSPAVKVVVKLDDEHERHLTVANFCIANARYFGGGMKIAPEARLTDGKFDVISIGDLGTRKILTNAPRIYLGSHLSMDQVHHAFACKVLARPAAKNDVIPIEIDGELPGQLPATFQILPRALRVRCPA